MPPRLQELVLKLYPNGRKRGKRKLNTLRAFIVSFMMNITELLGKTLSGKVINNSDDFCDWILEKQKVALVPGSGFGAEGFVRWSYATSMENIEKGLSRIKDFAGGLE